MEDAKVQTLTKHDVSRSSLHNVFVNKECSAALIKNPSKANFICEHCSFTTESDNSLRIHLAVLHADKLGLSEENCLYCKTKVPSAEFTKHLLSHQTSCLNEASKSIKAHTSKKVIKEITGKIPKEVETGTNFKIFLLKCPHCAFKSIDVNKLCIHIDDNHNYKDLFHCRFCLFTTKDVHNLTKHELHNHQFLKCCSFCSFKTLSSRLFNEHTHTWRNQMFSCNLCTFRCPLDITNSYINHYLDCHYVTKFLYSTREIEMWFSHAAYDSTLIVCNFCGFVTPVETFKKHIFQHLRPFSSPERIFCNRCDFKIDVVTEINSHLKEHNIIINPVKHTLYLKESIQSGVASCSKCDYKFSIRKKWMRHQVETHKNYKAKYPFRLISNYNFKTLTHTNYVQNKLVRVCNFCPESIQSTSDFLIHIPHHLKPFDSSLLIFCKSCSFYLDINEIMEEHFKTEHAALPNNYKNKKFHLIESIDLGYANCTDCDYKFSIYADWIFHQGIHTEHVKEKDWSYCIFCNLVLFNSHMAKHVDNHKVPTCKTCTVTTTFVYNNKFQGLISCLHYLVKLLQISKDGKFGISYKNSNTLYLLKQIGIKNYLRNEPKEKIMVIDLSIAKTNTSSNNSDINLKIDLRKNKTILTKIKTIMPFFSETEIDTKLSIAETNSRRNGKIDHNTNMKMDQTLQNPFPDLIETTKTNNHVYEDKFDFSNMEILYETDDNIEIKNEPLDINIDKEIDINAKSMDIKGDLYKNTQVLKRNNSETINPAVEDVAVKIETVEIVKKVKYELDENLVIKNEPLDIYDDETRKEAININDEVCYLDKTIPEIPKRDYIETKNKNTVEDKQLKNELVDIFENKNINLGVFNHTSAVFENKNIEITNEDVKQKLKIINEDTKLMNVQTFSDVNNEFCFDKPKEIQKNSRPLKKYPLLTKLLQNESISNDSLESSSHTIKTVPFLKNVAGKKKTSKKELKDKEKRIKQSQINIKMEHSYALYPFQKTTKFLAKKILKCPHCSNISSYYYSAIILHVYLCHSSKNSYCCCFCKEQNLTDVNFFKHLENHSTKIKKFKYFILETHNLSMKNVYQRLYNKNLRSGFIIHKRPITFSTSRTTQKANDLNFGNVEMSTTSNEKETTVKDFKIHEEIAIKEEILDIKEENL